MTQGRAGTPEGAPGGGGGPRFDADAYALASGHHRAHDDVVLDPLRLAPGTHVLDLGCGAGDLTVRLADLVDAGGPAGGSVLGVDASPSCAARTARLLRSTGRPRGVAAVAATAQSLGALLTPGCVDVVVSVATLHWVPGAQQAAVLAGVRSLLRPGGTLRVDMGGRGQVALLREVLAPLAVAAGAPVDPWFFPDGKAMTDLLARAGLRPHEVRLVEQRRALADEAAMCSWLTSQVLPAYLVHIARDRREAFTAAAVDHCRQGLRRADGSYDQDYVRLLATASSPGPAAPHGLLAGHAEAADEMARAATLLEVATEREDVTSRQKDMWHSRFQRSVLVSRESPRDGAKALALLGDELVRRLTGS